MYFSGQMYFAQERLVERRKAHKALTGKPAYTTASEFRSQLESTTSSLD